MEGIMQPPLELKGNPRQIITAGSSDVFLSQFVPEFLLQQ